MITASPDQHFAFVAISLFLASNTGTAHPPIRRSGFIDEWHVVIRKSFADIDIEKVGHVCEDGLVT
jgi:hypothetical protein